MPSIKKDEICSFIVQSTARACPSAVSTHVPEAPEPKPEPSCSESGLEPAESWFASHSLVGTARCPDSRAHVTHARVLSDCSQGQRATRARACELCKLHQIQRIKERTVRTRTGPRLQTGSHARGSACVGHTEELLSSELRLHIRAWSFLGPPLWELERAEERAEPTGARVPYIASAGRHPPPKKKKRGKRACHQTP